LNDSKPSPHTESLIASAVQWGERIMQRIDGVFETADERRETVKAVIEDAAMEVLHLRGELAGEVAA